MANKKKGKKNKNKKSSKGNQTEAVEEPHPPPTAEPSCRVLPRALPAAAKGTVPDSVPAHIKSAVEKITNTGFPRQREKRSVVESNEPPHGSHCVITIPPKHADRADDPDGHAECVLAIGTKKRLFGCPSFLTQRLPQAKPDTITIKDSTTGGLGVFAGRNITYGELLFAERPLLVGPAVSTFKIRGPNGWVHDTKLDEYFKRLCAEREKQLELAFGRLSEEKKDAYMALANTHKEEDGGGPLLGVQLTNGFGLDLNELTRDSGVVPEVDELRARFAAGVGLTPQEPEMYSFTAQNASRINHSCSPNAEFEFSLGSFSLQFFAERDIKAGEEIFTSYIDLYIPTTERREKLELYGFTCACTACSLSTLESDAFRETAASRMRIIDSLYKRAKGSSNNTNGTRSIRETILPTLLEFRRKLREDGLGVMSGPYLSSTLLLHDMHTHLGMLKTPEGERVLKDVMAWMSMKAAVQGRSVSDGVVTLKVPKI